MSKGLASGTCYPPSEVIKLVIERESTLKLVDVEPLLRQAARRMGTTVTQQQLAQGGTVFTIEHPELHKKLLSADIRFAAFLPCRIVAFDYRGGVKFVAMSPSQFAHDLSHSEVASTAALLENVLTEILVDLEHVVSTEEQVDMRDTVPQRIDEEGTKVEDLAGNGEQDSRGG